MSRASRPGHSRPTAVIVIAPDERSAEIAIEGHRQVVTGQAPKETRRAALDIATGYAARIGQPVLVDARDANGYWRLIATPDGVVQAAEQTPPEPPPAQPPAPGPATGGARGARSRGRTFLIAGAAVLALLLMVGLGAVALRVLPGTTPVASEDEAEGTTAALEHSAPPGFAPVVDISEELAPETLPAVSRDGEFLAYIDPEERLNLLGAEGARQWSVELPFGAAEGLGAPRFVEYGGETAIVVETAQTLWFWSAEGGSASSVELPEAASAQYVGESVLIRDEDSAYLLADGELEEIDPPGGSAPMLAEDGRVLTAVATGPWHWVEPGGEVERVHAERPGEAGEQVAMLTALREYTIIRWEPLQGEGSILAFHDSGDGSVLGSAVVEDDALEGLRQLPGPIGLELVAYGPVLLDPASGETAVVPGFVPEITVGARVFGELDGTRVALDASGEPAELPEDAETPRGLLGDRAVVVHDDHLYAIPPE